MASSRATTACGITSIWPSPLLVCRYISRRSRAPIQRIAAAPPFTARSMMAGGNAYSLKRSSHVEPISEDTRRIEPLTEAPALAKSSVVPKPTSIRFASIPPAGVAGDQPSATSRTENFSGPSNSRARVAFAPTGCEAVFFGVHVNAFRAKSRDGPLDGFAISGDPVTRPPISSVRRRRFSSIGDGPMT